MSEKPKRRWYQFSLKSLLLAVVVMAAALSWYGYRLRILEKERIRLAGTWYAEVDSVTVATFDADNLRTRPYACTQIEPYLTDKHVVPHFTTNIGKAGLAEPAAHVAPVRP